jgi:hypothetical protein
MDGYSARPKGVLESDAMEFGQYQIQILLTLVVILGAAMVALVCDLLKGNNEQLREFAIELKIRREEENRRFQMLAPHAFTAAAKAALQIEHPPAVPGAKRPVRREKRPLAPEALEAIQRGVQLAAQPRPHRVPDRVRSENPDAEHPDVEHSDVGHSDAEQAEVEIPLAEVIQAEVMASTSAVAVAPKSSGASRDWNSLLNARRHPVELNRTNPAAEAALPAGFPAGFHDGFVLTRLVETRQPVSGLVVSIGASTSQDTGRSLPSDVRAFIQSLIGPGDFAAQSGTDEFLLIYPGERGASAQRRLSQIAEQLWDFQLRSMGSLSILFSWGGLEVRSESIDEAIASATERMQETRRGRSRVLTMEPRADAPIRRAV